MMESHQFITFVQRDPWKAHFILWTVGFTRIFIVILKLYKLIYTYYCLKNRLWVLIEAVLMNTNKQCEGCEVSIQMLDATLRSSYRLTYAATWNCPGWPGKKYFYSARKLRLIFLSPNLTAFVVVVLVLSNSENIPGEISIWKFRFKLLFSV